MGYRITYVSPFIGKNRKTFVKKTINFKLISVVVIAFAVLFALFNTKLRRMILPGDPVVTERALSELVVDIRDGQPVSDAVTAFCREILENA